MLNVYRNIMATVNLGCKINLQKIALKVDNANEFIGLKIIDTDGDMFIELVSYATIAEDGCRRARFQHWCSNGSMASTVVVLYSRLVSTVDRCNDERLIHTNVVRLLIEFAYAGYPYFAVKNNVTRFMSRYNYRTEVQKGLQHVHATR